MRYNMTSTAHFTEEMWKGTYWSDQGHRPDIRARHLDDLFSNGRMWLQKTMCGDNISAEMNPFGRSQSVAEALEELRSGKSGLLFDGSKIVIQPMTMYCIDMRKLRQSQALRNVSIRLTKNSVDYIANVHVVQNVRDNNEMAATVGSVGNCMEPPNHYAWGEIRNVGGNLCIVVTSTNHNDQLGLESCVKDENDQRGEQFFLLTWYKDIRPRGRAVCFDISSYDNMAPVILYECRQLQGYQQWRYIPDTRALVHSNSGKCLDSCNDRKAIFISDCDASKSSQQWLFESYNNALLSKL
ncbi:uncharacterized protein LOC129587557 [Paramacrobiotus metropolitanus]|uniref:uncharacterized protein LOC129587557 n=1 Tax=Paramacrobiotus metropolitanus TaxID=2943436 RepID=UPI002445FF34|nr:uncharacterized protein LOC129587557 [Paramacrobiotus metropolitanus]